jgi:hypothetical protein
MVIDLAGFASYDIAPLMRQNHYGNTGASKEA